MIVDPFASENHKALGNRTEKSLQEALLPGNCRRSYQSRSGETVGLANSIAFKLLLYHTASDVELDTYPRQSTLDRVMIRCGEGAMDTQLGPLIERAAAAPGAAGRREVYVCRRPPLQGRLLR